MEGPKNGEEGGIYQVAQIRVPASLPMASDTLVVEPSYIPGAPLVSPSKERAGHPSQILLWRCPPPQSLLPSFFEKVSHSVQVFPAPPTLAMLSSSCQSSPQCRFWLCHISASEWEPQLATGLSYGSVSSQ